MKKILSLVTFTFLAFQVIAQKTPLFQYNCKASYSDSLTTKSVSASWEYDYVYPQEALENGIQGTVLVAFDITDSCQIVNIKVEKGLGYGLDEVAVVIMTELGKEIQKNPKLCACSNFTTKGQKKFPLRFKLR